MKISLFIFFLILLFQSLSAGTIYLKNTSTIPDHALMVQWGTAKIDPQVPNQAETFAPTLSIRDSYFTLRIADFAYCTHRAVVPGHRYCNNASAPLKAQDGKVYIVTGVDVTGNIIVEE